MASSSDPKPFKKRPNRQRKPPLAPGPPLQFVVASHPDDFKTGGTMRRVRSHVMYTHREGLSPTDTGGSQEGSMTPIIMTRTPSPATAGSRNISQMDSPQASTPTRRHDTVWEQEPYDFHTLSPSTHPVRVLAARIHSAIAEASTHGAPPAFDEVSGYPFPRSNVLRHEPLDELKRDWACDTTFYCYDQAWMQYVCSNHLSFLSHVHATLVYQDLDEGLLYDSDLTVYAKTRVLGLFRGRLDTDDATIISILHMLISEIGSPEEDAFSVHQDGLVTCLRNKQDRLGPNIATFMTLIMLTFAICRGQDVPIELTPRVSSEVWLDHNGPVSPLLAPQEQMPSLYRVCSAATTDIIWKMQRCTCTFLARWNHKGEPYMISSGQLASCDAELQNIYSDLLLLPSAEDDHSLDWVYESCRIAALIYCRSIVYGATLAESANIMHARISGSSVESVTLLSALHSAIGRTKAQTCWDFELSGAFLWVALVGAAASQSPPHPSSEETLQASAWMRKCFALYAVRAAVSVPFDYADATIHALRTMLQVQRFIAIRKGLTFTH
ncbi:hypothetical protein G6011_07153 [Alternaria panax]|uniref:Tachykinin family protein n=1 Tax=Alternaria panax TaxID=48097 RepID=A0AAD4F9T8_9PLEO|nr:hypothetical protein G6011_07153 [Alternaria panax]